MMSLSEVVVTRMLIENLKGKVVDIDNVYLNGDLEHEMCILRFQKGMMK